MKFKYLIASNVGQTFCSRVCKSVSSVKTEISN